MRHISLVQADHAVADLRIPTPRELQILELILEGQGNKEISYRLGLTEGTVKEYLNRIFHGAGVTSRVQLVVWCLQNAGIFEGCAGRRGLHPADCACAGFYCSLMRRIAERHRLREAA